MNYQEILAQSYRDREVEEFTEEETEPDADSYAEREYDVSELADPDAFKKFAGNRGHPETLPKSTQFTDKGKNSMRYEKDIQIYSFNIDSRFRDYSKITNQANTTLARLFPTPAANTSVDSSGNIILGGNLAQITPSDAFAASQSSNFVFSLPRTIKNVYSVALTSIEFPNTFYEFDKELYNNTTMTIIDLTNPSSGVPYNVLIPDGNYDTFVNFASAVEYAIKNSVDASSGVVNTVFQTFKVTYSTLKGKMIFSNPTQFTFKFPKSIHPTGNGLGYFLGFSQTDYTNNPSQTGEISSSLYGNTVAGLVATYGVPNTGSLTTDYRLAAENIPVILSNNYIYIALNDWDVIVHRDFSNAHFYAFAKIMVPNVKYTVVYDSDTTNTTVKEYFFQQPKDITKIAITLYDAYGNILNLQGADFSFTLELKQILNMNLYESLREL
jgi:hypothetical protein